MTLTIWVLSTCIPGEPLPCYPMVFGSEAAAIAEFDKCMQEEWETNGPAHDDGEPIPYPDDPFRAVELIAADDVAGSWGRWELTSHQVEMEDEPLVA